MHRYHFYFFQTDTIPILRSEYLPILSTNADTTTTKITPKKLLVTISFSSTVTERELTPLP